MRRLRVDDLGHPLWATAVRFGPDIHLGGVSAVSASAALVWGEQGRDDDWTSYRPFLALVSGGGVHRVRAAFLNGVDVSAMASDGTAEAWLAGGARDRKGHFPGQVMARWDGTSWHEVPVPQWTARHGR